MRGMQRAPPRARLPVADDPLHGYAHMGPRAFAKPPPADAAAFFQQAPGSQVYAPAHAPPRNGTRLPFGGVDFPDDFPRFAQPGYGPPRRKNQW